MKPPNINSLSSQTSQDKTHDKNEKSIENGSITQSKLAHNELTVSQTQTTILEPEKINELSAENGSDIISFEKQHWNLWI